MNLNSFQKLNYLVFIKHCSVNGIYCCINIKDYELWDMEINIPLEEVTFFKFPSEAFW